MEKIGPGVDFDLEVRCCLCVRSAVYCCLCVRSAVYCCLCVRSSQLSVLAHCRWTYFSRKWTFCNLSYLAHLSLLIACAQILRLSEKYQEVLLISVRPNGPPTKPRVSPGYCFLERDGSWDRNNKLPSCRTILVWYIYASSLRLWLHPLATKYLFHASSHSPVMCFVKVLRAVALKRAHTLEDFVGPNEKLKNQIVVENPDVFSQEQNQPSLATQGTISALTFPSSHSLLLFIERFSASNSKPSFDTFQ